MSERANMSSASFPSDLDGRRQFPFTPRLQEITKPQFGPEADAGISLIVKFGTEADPVRVKTFLLRKTDACLRTNKIEPKYMTSQNGLL